MMIWELGVIILSQISRTTVVLYLINVIIITVSILLCYPDNDVMSFQSWCFFFAGRHTISYQFGGGSISKPFHQCFTIYSL